MKTKIAQIEKFQFLRWFELWCFLNVERKPLWMTSVLFGGTTDTPVLDIFWHLPWISKPGLIPSCACFVAYMQWIPQIHLWYGTCWPVDDSHATLDLCTCTCTSIGGAWVQEWVCHCLTVCDKTHALLNELCWLGKLKLKYSLHITSLGGSFTRPIRSTNILKSIRKDSNSAWDNGAHL